MSDYEAENECLQAEIEANARIDAHLAETQGLVMAMPTYRQFGHFETAEQQLRAAVLHTAIQFCGRNEMAEAEDVYATAEVFMAFIKGEDITLAAGELPFDTVETE